MTNTAVPQKQFLVKRKFTTPDMGPMGGGDTFERYVTTEKPRCGESIYHGSFEKHTDYGDQKYSKPVDYYVPTDSDSVTWEPYKCAPGTSSGGAIEF